MRWVAAQSALMAAVVVACFFPPRPHLAAVGVPLVVLGLALAVWAARTLGPAFTPFPEPRGPRISRGPYRFLRHPTYVGATVAFVGVSLTFSWIALAPTAALGILWAAKGRVETRLLDER